MAAARLSEQRVKCREPPGRRASAAGSALATAKPGGRRSCLVPPTNPDQYGPDPRHTWRWTHPPGEASGGLLLVLLHGGGWVGGDQDDLAGAADALARHGLATCTLNYRLAPDHPFPAQADDLVLALSRIDAPDLVLVGHSAGGHLAALVTLDPRYLARRGLTAARIRGVVGLSGVYDLTRAATSTWMRQRWLTPTFGPSPEALREASPVTWARPQAPPFLLVNAAVDWGLHRHSEALAAALQAVGGEVEHLRVDDRNHVSLVAGMADPADPATLAVVAFGRRVSASR